MIKILLWRFLSAGFTVYYFLLLAYAFMSWVPSLNNSPFGKWIRSVVAPFVQPLRRLNLRLGNFDFTILLAIYLLNVLRSVLFRLFFGW